PGALLAQPPTHPSQLALALRSALVRSGLFYESHLASWAVGKDSLSGLMQEPQNRVAAETARAALPDARTAADPRTANPMHALLAQQLQVLEAPHFGWRGELWPGQSLDWQVRRGHDPQPQDANVPDAEDAEPAWESSLKLTLPQLGTVNVQIKLDSAQNFRIRMTPEQPESTPVLQANQAGLVKRLTEAGCSLHSVKVEPHVDT
ncbi:MAG: flagellar hook-length control protein FliK, partial [Thiobacillus sp.]